MIRVHIPRIFPQDLAEQLQDALEALPTLTASTLSSADYIILNNITHLDVTLHADLLRNIAWSCSGYRRPQASVALKSDWLIDSLKRGRALAVWGYQIEVVWHRISEPGEAWMEWRDARGRPIESEAGRKLVLGAGGPAVEDISGGAANLWGFDEDTVSCEDPLKIGGVIPNPTPDAEMLQSSDEEDDSQATKIVDTVFHPPAPAATKRRKTSSKANPFTTKRRRPRKTARPPATVRAPKGPIKRSISALTELINRKSPPPAGPPAAGGASVKKRQRQREVVREEDKAALDKIVGLLAAAIANDDHLKPTRSLGRLCEELDCKDPHPKGIQWKSFYRSYELFVLDRVPGLAEWLQNRSRSTSVLVSGA